jgi:hypothetical protein
VPTYLAESYLPKGQQNGLQEVVRRTRLVVPSLLRDGMSVRHVRSTYLPEDEMCIHVFEAESKEAVLALSTRAAVDFDRVVEALEDSAELPERSRR